MTILSARAPEECRATLAEAPIRNALRPAPTFARPLARAAVDEDAQAGTGGTRDRGRGLLLARVVTGDQVAKDWLREGEGIEVRWRERRTASDGVATVGVSGSDEARRTVRSASFGDGVGRDARGTAVVVVETEEAGHVRGSALLWLVFETSAEGSGDVLAGKVAQVGLVVDGDCGMGVDLLKILPGSVFSEDSIV